MKNLSSILFDIVSILLAVLIFHFQYIFINISFFIIFFAFKCKIYGKKINEDAYYFFLDSMVKAFNIVQ